MTYVMATLVGDGSSPDEIIVSDVIRVTEIPIQDRNGGMAIKLAVLTDLYFSVPRPITLKVSGFTMQRYADEDTDIKLLRQYHEEVLKMRAQKSGLATPPTAEETKRLVT